MTHHLPDRSASGMGAAALHEIADIPLAMLVPRYRAYLVGIRRPQGVARYLWGFKRTLRWLEERLGRAPLLSDLDAAMCRRYKEALAAKGAANSTIINALSQIKDFSSFCIEEGLRANDPTAGIKRPPKRRPDPNPLDEHDLAFLMRAIQMPPDLPSWRVWYWQRNVRLLLTLIYTGLRLSEIAALRWEHVKMGRGVIVVVEGKGGKDRRVPLHDDLTALLRAVPKAEQQAAMPVIGRRTGNRETGPIAPMTAKGIATIFPRWLGECFAGAATETTLHVHAHRLRHTFASLLVWNDVDLRTLQELLGHAQLSTTEHYVKVRDQDKRKAVNRLPSLA